MSLPPIRITQTQRGLLQFLVDCGGTGQIYTGHRTWSCNLGLEVAHCNLVSEYFLLARKAMVAVESNRPGLWYRITEYGRETLDKGKWIFAPSDTPTQPQADETS